MAASERAFWAAAAGINPAGLSVNDVKLRALRQATGLSTGSLADCERKFYADRLGVSPLGKSLTDLEKQYYKSLGVDLNVVRKNLALNPSFEVDTTGWAFLYVTPTLSTSWAAVGGSCVSLQPNNASNDSYANIDGDAGALRAGLKKGKTYTVSGTVYPPVALTGAQRPARARGIAVFTKSPTINGGNYVELRSAQGPEGVATRVGVTFSVPSDATEAFIRLYNGGDNSSANIVMWDGILLEENTSTINPYFDGNTSPDPALSSAWLGAANASQSVLINNTFKRSVLDMERQYLKGTLNPDWSWTAP